MKRATASLGRTTRAIAAMVAVMLAITVPAARTSLAEPEPWSADAAHLASPEPATIRTSLVPGETNQFGAALALAGDRVVVGHAVKQTTLGRGPGLDHPERAFVLRRVADAWTLEATLTPPAADVDGTSLEFSRAVAMSRDATTIVVGAPYAPGPGDQSQSGRAYVFVRDGTTWALTATLASPNPGENDRFGVSVAVDGGTIVVGAEGDRADLAGAPDALNGAAYVFTRSAGVWSTTPTAVLRSDALQPGAGFGQQVAVSGTTVAVGDVTQGSVHVFVGAGATWDRQARLDGVFATSNHGIALDGDVLAVGSEWLGDFPTKGGAFVATRSGSTWSAPVDLVGVLEAGGATKPAWFGGAVAVDGEVVAVGTGRGVGAVLVFETTSSGIVLQQELTRAVSSPFNTRQFGRAVAVHGPLLVAGAPFECQSCDADDPDDVFNAGVVFTFSDPTRATAVEEPEDPEDGDGADGDASGNDPTTDGPPTWQPSDPTWIPTPENAQPREAPSSGVMQREGGRAVRLVTSSTGPGELAYGDGEGFLIATFTGDRTTGVERGLVATRDGTVQCEVCASGLRPGEVVEIWAFSTPRLVAAAVVDADGCISALLPLSAPLDGGPGIPVGEHTLQVTLPLSDGEGRLAVNVGVTIPPLAPTGIPAGEGPSAGMGAHAPSALRVPIGALLLGLLGSVLTARARQVR